MMISLSRVTKEMYYWCFKSRFTRELKPAGIQKEMFAYGALVRTFPAMYIFFPSVVGVQLLCQIWEPSVGRDGFR